MAISDKNTCYVQRANGSESLQLIHFILMIDASATMWTFFWHLFFVFDQTSSSVAYVCFANFWFFYSWKWFEWKHNRTCVPPCWRYSKECYRIEIIRSERNKTAFLIFVNEYIDINWNCEINSMIVGSLNWSPFSRAEMKCWKFLVVCKYNDNLPSVGVQNDWRKNETLSKFWRVHSISLRKEKPFKYSLNCMSIEYGNLY